MTSYLDICTEILTSAKLVISEIRNNTPYIVEYLKCALPFSSSSICEKTWLKRKAIHALKFKDKGTVTYHKNLKLINTNISMPGNDGPKACEYLNMNNHC